MAEQEYIKELIDSLEWNSNISIESFQTSCISKINEVVSGSDEQISLYLSDLMQEISDLGIASKAIRIAKEISDSDGEIADDEVRYLELIKCYK